MPVASPRRTANVVAVTVIVGILAALAVIVVAGERAASLHGPLALAIKDGSIYFQAGRHIYTVDGGGHLVQRVSLEQLGIEGSTVDIEFVGEALWLLQDDGQIKRCGIREASCSSLFTIAKGRLYGAASQMKVDEARGRVYVSLAARHRVDVYTLTGDRIAELVPERPFLFPNGVFLTDSGVVVVADTNNHRIVALAPSENSTNSVWEFSAKTILARPRHVWPASIERDGRGRWWVINMDDGMVDGDLLVFSSEGKPQRRVDLPAGADPINVARLGNSMLVADYEGFGLFKIAEEGQRLELFGDDALRRHLMESKRTRDGWRLTRSITIVSILAMALLGGIALYLDRRAAESYRRELWQREPQPLSTPAGTQVDKEGVTWITVSPPKQRLLRIVLYIGLGAWAVQALFAVPFFADPRMILLWLPIIPLLLAICIVVRRIANTRIGLARSRIELVDARGRRAEGRLEEVVYSKRSLMLHGITVNFRLFAREALDEVLLPRLFPARKVGHLHILWSQAKTNAVALLILLAMVMMISASAWNASSLEVPDLKMPLQKDAETR